MHASQPLVESPLHRYPAAESSSAGSRVQSSCSLSDWSLLPRVGFRGSDTPEDLSSQGYQLPEQANQACWQADGSLLLRLSAKEFMLLAASQRSADTIDQLEQGWQQSARRHYLLPRADSHAWLHLSGADVPQLMAKLCAIDLRAAAFAPLALVQTSVARNTAIVVNSSQGETPQFELLCDRATARYLCDVLVDGMAEFSGQVLAATSGWPD
ncbi:aminomethyltransferase family protein [Halopseudomonas salegens]|uniref:N-methylglutamate dehydrogenase subunit D n=1 Tax=Halopseudomonas salegens TaxID=1434072 RepID=A0A1H2HGE8_9GAMM|nr:hypothetical protein [Halopseudomonas salegens]SDU30914.1 N-methylglutamate dehydrogenase subunit D [Halopseudomonas salegens]